MQNAIWHLHAACPTQAPACRNARPARPCTPASVPWEKHAAASWLAHGQARPANGQPMASRRPARRWRRGRRGTPRISRDLCTFGGRFRGAAALHALQVTAAARTSSPRTVHAAVAVPARVPIFSRATGNASDERQRDRLSPGVVKHVLQASFGTKVRGGSACLPGIRSHASHIHPSAPALSACAARSNLGRSARGRFRHAERRRATGCAAPVSEGAAMHAVMRPGRPVPLPRLPMLPVLHVLAGMDGMGGMAGWCSCLRSRAVGRASELRSDVSGGVRRGAERGACAGLRQQAACTQELAQERAPTCPRLSQALSGSWFGRTRALAPD